MKGKAIVLALGMVILAAGCQNWNMPRLQMPGQSTQPPADMPPTGQPGLAISSEQRFPDVPLPIGMTADVERTYVYDSGNLKVGRLVYTTRASASEIGEFYLREAPAAGWKFERMVESEVLELYFSKDGKRMTVSVLPLGMGRGRRLVINYNPSDGTNP
ncbi:MAG: hypothetical protein RBU21_23190 [FCB group bacterium]|nr:hypothetical protein [FCB group bacterium]